MARGVITLCEKPTLRHVIHPHMHADEPVIYVHVCDGLSFQNRDITVARGALMTGSVLYTEKTWDDVLDTWKTRSDDEKARKLQIQDVSSP